MPSTLNGLLRTLTWSDFPPPRQGNAPAAGTQATAAFTFTTRSFSGLGFTSVAGSHPPQFQLVDNLTVSAGFDRGRSFVMNWVFSRSQQFQDDMLNHEQGHYNITALACRDFFVDVMLLKGGNFSSSHAGDQAVTQVRTNSFDKIQQIHDLYDREVHPEQNSGQSRGPIQQSWDRFFQTAFTQARTTGTQAPNGVAHKVKLIDVLTSNGKRI